MHQRGVCGRIAGTVVLDGQDVTGWRPDLVTRAGLVRTFQLARGIGRLSVLDNLMLYTPALEGEGWLAAAALGRGKAAQAAALEQAWDVVRRLNLHAVANNPAAALSGGQKKLLEFGAGR